jgi:hypothetical protein
MPSTWRLGDATTACCQWYDQAAQTRTAQRSRSSPLGDVEPSVGAAARTQLSIRSETHLHPWFQSASKRGWTASQDLSRSMDSKRLRMGSTARSSSRTRLEGKKSSSELTAFHARSLTRNRRSNKLAERHSLRDSSALQYGRRSAFLRIFPLILLANRSLLQHRMLGR